MTIYLYIKTHRKTGLKYLGKTERDPYKYRGSGKYWRLHIRKHGADIDTQILRECKTVDEVKEWGIYYSKLWNVVECNEWANLKEEYGDGNSSDTAKELWENPLYREKQTAAHVKLWNNEDYRTQQNESRKKSWQNTERLEKKKNQFLEMWADQEFAERMSSSKKELWKDPVYKEKLLERRKQQSGKNHHNYDDTLFHFIHDDGVEEHCTKNVLYTKYGLIPGKVRLVTQGKRNVHKGWRIKKTDEVSS